MRIVLTAVLLAGSTAVTIALGRLGFFVVGGNDVGFAIAIAALWILFGASLLALRGVDGRPATVLVVVGGVVLALAALSGPPNTSTDSARYAWDGIVQNAGISPYRYAPDAPELAALRPDWLFPAWSVGSDGFATCTIPRTMMYTDPSNGLPLCSTINRLPVPTIYPPIAEFVFAVVRFVAPVDGYLPMQVFGAVAALAVMLILLRILRRRGMRPHAAAVWAWCPLVLSEAVTNAHIDVLGVLFVVVATALSAGDSRWRAGAALGAAIATKLIPVIAAPALVRRRPIAFLAAAVGVFVVVYVPYVATSGIQVLGYLPGYLTEEGYNSGTRFLILSAFFPGPSATVAAAVLLLVVAVLVIRRTDPADPWLGQLVMIGATLVIVSPSYVWYTLLLIPMIVVTRRWEWMAVPIALALRGFSPEEIYVRDALIVAVVIVVAGSMRRSRTSLKLWKS